MSKTEGGDPLGPGFAHRLRSELDRVRPQYSAPRYATAPSRRIGAWRFAPVALVISVAGMIALTASVATGSTNPVVWTEQVVTKIHSEPVASPSPVANEHSPAPPAAAPATHAPARPSSAAPPTSQAQPSGGHDDSESGEAKESPQASASPRPSPSADH